MGKEKDGWLSPALSDPYDLAETKRSWVKEMRRLANKYRHRPDTDTNTIGEYDEFVKRYGEETASSGELPQQDQSTESGLAGEGSTEEKEIRDVKPLSSRQRDCQLTSTWTVLVSRRELDGGLDGPHMDSKQGPRL